ncbi:DUF1499 domain-containing protein [Pontivivens ytuae]|uniref:DUF1499 domain-containing protein n=1 Tax=Pontivivens ytuae TaxID=2789856 RepID=A0A7S9LRT6_9RHOB|nr:DUF1499 domain-containing protein [Pontivivens ytuae]QPH53914.1 DUF1499 domain-containing protein [Pontivivens ytuae]
MIGKIAFAVAVLIIIAGIVSVLMIRNLGHDAQVWHVDPLTAPTPESPNSFRMVPQLEGFAPLTEERVDATAPIYNANPALLSQSFDEFVLRQPRVERIAGTPEQNWMTYVQESENLRFPDYISVKFVELADGQSSLAIFSRARLGYSDMGVNQQRVESWLQAIQQFESDGTTIAEDGWHVDPLTAPLVAGLDGIRIVPVLDPEQPITDQPIDYASPIFQASPAELSQVFDAGIMEGGSARRIAGEPGGPRITYALEDLEPLYMTVGFFDLENGQSTLAIFARGSSEAQPDLSDERIQAWFGPVAALVAQ